MKLRKKIRNVLIAALLFKASTGSFALACLGIQVSASELNFGSYNSLSSSNLTSSFEMQIECLFDIGLPGTFPLSYDVGIDSSLPDVNGLRKIKHQSLDYYLDYALYSDSGLSQIIGSITSIDTINGSFASISLDKIHLITGFGIIPGNQNVPAGDYSDLPTITVEF